MFSSFHKFTLILRIFFHNMWLGLRDEHRAQIVSSLARIAYEQRTQLIHCKKRLGSTCKLDELELINVFNIYIYIEGLRCP